jgi:hypothetical protein
MSIISSHTGFQPLEEVWLGGVYPDIFYNHFDNKTQDIFCKLNELTNIDLVQIEQKLVELGVSVCRPQFDKIENYLDEADKLIKPPITPRDWAITIGTTLYINPQYYSGVEPFQVHLDRYRQQQQDVVILDRSIPDPMCYITPPSVVRVGKDLYIDYKKRNDMSDQLCELTIESLSKFYRVHVTHTGDHSDGVFCPVAPGHIFSTFYKKTYHDTFPDWDIFFLTDTASKRVGYNGGNNRWWLPGFNYPHVNDQVISIANNWIGDSRETIFEVNMLVIDEKNVICIAEDDVACRKLENLGITPHVVNFKTRGFWDGGIHCLTTDIKRTGNCIDYWPGRGAPGVYRY